MRVGLGLKSEKEGVQCGSYRGECGVSTGPAYKNHRLWKCREMREVTCCPRFRSPACCLFLPEWCGVVPLTPHPTTVCNRLLSVTSPILTSHSILNNCTILSRNLRKKINNNKHNLFNFYCCCTCFQTTYTISPYLPSLYI